LLEKRNDKYSRADEKSQAADRDADLIASHLRWPNLSLTPLVLYTNDARSFGGTAPTLRY
jgi:hypothetical protein